MAGRDPPALMHLFVDSHGGLSLPVNPSCYTDMEQLSYFNGPCAGQPSGPGQKIVGACIGCVLYFEDIQGHHEHLKIALHVSHLTLERISEQTSFSNMQLCAKSLRENVANDGRAVDMAVIHIRSSPLNTTYKQVVSSSS